MKPLLQLLTIALGLTSVLTDELEQFVVGNNAFTSDVYKQIAKQQTGSLLVCPLSAEIVLALVRLGAKNRTAEQLTRTLRLPATDEGVVQTFGGVAATLRGNDKYTLTSANKIYLENGYRIEERFRRAAVDVFDADIENVDFSRKKQAAATMNGWVEEKTHGKITNLIVAEALKDNSRAVLINVLYFKGTWKQRFAEHQTRMEAFYVDGNKTAMVETMRVTARFKYHESVELKAKFLEMVYDGDDITMTVVLPDEAAGLSALEAKIPEILLPPKYTVEDVLVKIPKFKEEKTIDFKGILQSLGVKDLFDDCADLRGLGAPGQGTLQISDVIQKTVIEVDEKGTTAVAATSVHGFTPFSKPYVPISKYFIADHPFVYYLSSPVGVMFIGRFVKD